MKKIIFSCLILFFSYGFSQDTTDFPVFDGTFDGATYAQLFTFPTTAESWAGFANNNTNIYPLSFPDGGKITFKATVAADAEVYFRFEANPHPNVDPAINTSNISLLASNPDNTAYEVSIPANASNTYNSAIMYVVTKDVPVAISEFKIITLDSSNAAIKTDVPVYDGIFGGAIYAQTFTFPTTGAETWAGFANNNTNIYPLKFTAGGKVTFKATVASDTDVYFRFEANPHPNVDPAINTSNTSLLASNPDNTVYEIEIPSHATNTYNSAIFYVVARDVGVNLSEVKIITNEDTAGLKDSEISSIYMHPNPAKQHLRFSSTLSTPLSVHIFDLLGKEVLKSTDVKATMDISSLNSGVYLVKMIQDQNITTKKLLIN